MLVNTFPRARVIIIAQIEDACSFLVLVRGRDWTTGTKVRVFSVQARKPPLNLPMDEMRLRTGFLPGEFLELIDDQRFVGHDHKVVAR
jgi:hypothetical protein